jgi:hypothetical protein
MYILCVYAIMAPAHESETIVFNFRKLLSTLPNYANKADRTSDPHLLRHNKADRTSDPHLLRHNKADRTSDHHLLRHNKADK